MAGKPKEGSGKGEKRRPGRADIYKPEFNVQATELCYLGATDEDLARFFGVTERSITNWKNKYPDFASALKKGKELADASVAKRLYQRALGFAHKEEKLFCHEGKIIRAETVKQYPPEVIACIFWLKNRRPDLWRDKPLEMNKLTEMPILEVEEIPLDDDIKAIVEPH